MKKRSNIYVLLAFALMLVLACAMLPGLGYSRYVTERAVANEVSYTNKLAESFKLLDIPAVQQEDGSYAQDTASDAQPTSGFSYKLIPGITLPAAPYVEITGKTPIPAYLYLEVENTGPVTLSFNSSWTELSGVTGKKGGSVYVYDGGTALTGDDPEAVLTVQTFTVEELDPTPTEDEGDVKVYAYMIQKVEDTTYEQAFTDAPAL